MKCLKIIFTYCVLYAFVVAANKDDHQGDHRHQQKSHINKHTHEKSHGSNPVSDRHKKTESRVHSSSHVQHLAYRDGNQHCQVVCNNGSAYNITRIRVLYNGSAGIGLLAFENDSTHIAVIQDYYYNITVILNGKSGSAVVTDNTKQTFYSIDKNSDTEGILWLASKEDFTTYFKNLANLQKQLKLGEEHGKRIGSIQEFGQIVSSDLDSVGYAPSVANYTIFLNFISHLNGTLKFIFNGQGSFTTQKGIIWFAKLNLAFANIFSDCKSKELQSADLKLNLSLVYGADSNIRAFFNLLAQIGSHLDLSKVFSNGISSPERLLQWLRQITDDSDVGEDGIVTVIITVISALSGHASLSQVIDVIANYTPGDSQTSIAQLIDDFLDLIEAQGRQFNNSAAFSAIVTVLKALNNKNYVYKNIYISDIITLLTSRNPITMFQTIGKIFSRLFSAEGFVHYIQDFLANISSPNGLGAISRLFPGVDPRNIAQFFQSFFSRIPVLGNFLNSTNLANGFNISSIVDSNPFSQAFKNITAHSPVETAVDGFRNASSGIVSGVQNAVHNFLGGFGGFLGSENNGSTTPASSTSAANTTTEDPKASEISESSPSSQSSSSANGVSTPESGTEGVTYSSTNDVTQTASSESTNATTTLENADSTTPTTPASTGSSSQAPILRKGYIHRVHEKKAQDAHHLHAANRKGHENLKHNLHEKSNHHAKLHELNRHENIQHKKKLHAKDYSVKNHKTAQEKKQDHHNHHN